MIRGAIERVEPEFVSGWIYSASSSLRDQVVVAFVGDRCVGTGTIDGFRKDLLEAKLGDGYCGFTFPISFLPGESQGSLVVKLQRSDVALLQAASRVVGPMADRDSDAAAPDFGAVKPGSVTWMQDRGWLEQHEHDFLKAIHTAGAYERGLRANMRAAANPESLVHGALCVYSLAHIELVRTQLDSMANLLAAQHVWRKAPVSVIALWGEEQTWITIAEGSHIGPPEGRGQFLEEPPASRGIDYQFGPDRILFLHRDCSFTAYNLGVASGITLFTATPRRPGFRPAPGNADIRWVEAELESTES
jgi:hypothetical protein